MNAIPIPQPRTAGGRPPFEPPRKTTFDSSPGDDREPEFVVIRDSVNNLLKHVKACEPERLWVMLGLIRDRIKLVESELFVERLISTDPLPPTLKSLYTLDFLFEENEPIVVYMHLLESLQEAEQSVIAKMLDQNPESPASDL